MTISPRNFVCFHFTAHAIFLSIPVISLIFFKCYLLDKLRPLFKFLKRKMTADRCTPSILSPLHVPRAPKSGYPIDADRQKRSNKQGPVLERHKRVSTHGLHYARPSHSPRAAPHAYWLLRPNQWRCKPRCPPK